MAFINSKLTKAVLFCLNWKDWPLYFQWPQNDEEREIIHCCTETNVTQMQSNHSIRLGLFPGGQESTFVILIFTKAEQWFQDLLRNAHQNRRAGPYKHSDSLMCSWLDKNRVLWHSRISAQYLLVCCYCHSDHVHHDKNKLNVLSQKQLHSFHFRHKLNAYWHYYALYFILICKKDP